MRQKFIFTTAVCLCAVLAFGFASAAERDRDYNSDRAKRTILGGPQEVESTDIVDIQATFDQYTLGPVQNQMILIDAPGAQMASEAQQVQNAYKLLVQAGQQSDSDAISTLSRILRMDLPSSPQADKIMAGAYERMSTLYGHSTTKQLFNLSQAMQYAAGSQRRDIENQIQDLGGDAFAMAFNTQQAVAVQGGGNDTCDVATNLGTPSFSVLADNVISGEHDWYSFDVVTGDSGIGQNITIETIDNGTGGFDDTDMNLYSSCDAGVPGGFLEFDDDGGSGFMSFIDRACMAEGTYYLEVGGFADVSQADDFNLEVTVVSTGCFVRTPDAFEPDNDRAGASQIGIATPPGTPGAVQSEIQAEEVQAHNIFPSGDNDMVKFDLNDSSLMVLKTAKQIGTIFNGFVDIPLPGFGEDTVIDLLYSETKDYGGLCNQQVAPFTIDGNFPCGLANAGSDCPDPLSDPIPGFPDCLPWSLFGAPINDWPAENVLASNDDADLAGGDLGSELTVCLPRTDVANPASSVDAVPFSWYLNTRPFGSLDFDYEVMVHNSAKCRFESEPNNSLGLPAADADGSEGSGDSKAKSKKSCGSKAKSKGQCAGDTLPNALVLGESIYGINEFSVATQINALDVDVFSFDIAAPALLTFETLSNEPGVTDTTLDIFVGPDMAGDFFFTGLTDDDGGNNLLSRIKANFIPACELLGTCPASGGSEASKAKSKAATGIDTEYFIAVGAAGRAPDFPYELASSVGAVAQIDTEPNDACPSEAQAITVGDTVLGSIGVSCDFDTYSFSLTEATLVSFETLTGGDTTMELSDAACDRIGCDDDGGVGLASALASCLPAGDYNLRIRAFSPLLLFNYNLETDGETGCLPDDPPTTTADGLFLCAGDFDTCIPTEPPDFIEGGVDLADCNGNGGAQPTAQINIGDLVAGDIVPTCDYDSYAFSLGADTEVFIRGFGGDFTLQLEDSGCNKIVCDDDTGSGGGSPYEPLLAGCLGAGDYVVRTRPFSNTVTFAYTIDFGDLGPCDANVDAPVAGDEAFTCTDFDNGQSCTAP